MKKIVVYDSYFGNTGAIAEAIGTTLGEDTQVIKVHALKLDSLKDYDIIVIGSPTRAFRPTKEIKQLVKKLEVKTPSSVAIFDTRMHVEEAPKILRFLSSKFGYSNDTLEKILSKKNITPKIPSGAFYVRDTEGPLFEDEIHLAQKWSQQLL